MTTVVFQHDIGDTVGTDDGAGIIVAAHAAVVGAESAVWYDVVIGGEVSHLEPEEIWILM